MKRIEWLAKKPEPRKDHYLIARLSCLDFISIQAWWTGTDPREALRACQTAILDGYAPVIYQEVKGKWVQFGDGHVRDPDDICEDYEPGLLGKPGTCNGSDHYLCAHCACMRPSNTAIGESDEAH
jgi:hypothetical protein